MEDDNQTSEQLEEDGRQKAHVPDHDAQAQQANATAGGRSENANTSENIDPHKAVAVVGYIFPLIFFIPLLSEEAKGNSFAMFHANQQLILLIAVVILIFINVIPILGTVIWFFGLIALFFMAIANLLAAADGRKKRLPFMGGYEIL